MRAILCRAFGSLAVEEMPAPVPGPGELLIRSRMIAVNYPDMLVVTGRYQLLPPFPFVPGKEAVGTVIAVGPDVADFRPGDRVLAELEHGAFAAEFLAPALHCHRVPDEIGDAEAASLGIPYQTAFFALMERAQYRAGETVLVTGAGGAVGSAGVQLAKAKGATVLAGVSRPERAPLARDADHIIDLGRANLRDALRDQVRAALGGKLVDIVLDPVGGDAFDAALRALAWRGRLVVIGFAAGRIPEVKANYLLVKNIAVSGIQWSDYRDRQVGEVRRAQAEIFALCAAGRLKPPIMTRLPLERFAEAFALVEAAQTTGRVLLTP